MVTAINSRAWHHLLSRALEAREPIKILGRFVELATATILAGRMPCSCPGDPHNSYCDIYRPVNE